MTPTRSLGTAGRVLIVYTLIGVVALITRVAPFLVSGVLTSIREYDDGVMYAGSLALSSGEVPYRDFTFLHPPGALLALLPFAAVGRVGGVALGLGVARLTVVVLGAVNAILVARLLRSRGVVAMLVGGLGYAVWSAAVLAERTVLLEPALNTGLLVALMCVTRSGRRAALAAGAALGVVVAVKYWAVVDIVLVGTFVASRFGRRGLGRFAVGVAAGAGLVMLPFFVAAPEAIWRQTVVTQLGRPNAVVSLDARAHAFSLLGGYQGPDAAAPGVLWIAGLVLVVAAGLAPMATAWLRRTDRRSWPDSGWWAVIAAVHLLVLFVASSFYYHYAAWAAAPVVLVAGSLAGAVVQRHRSATRVLLGAAAVVVVALLAGQLRHLPAAQSSRGEAVSWAQRRTCVWGTAPQLVWADAAARDIVDRCEVFVDSFGTGLTLDPPPTISSDAEVTVGNPRWRAAIWTQIESADGVMVPTGTESSLLDAEHAAAFRRDFVLDETVGGIGLWHRVGTAG